MRIHKASIPLLYSSIYYLPQSYIVNREVFNYEFELVRKELFHCLENFSELVFIDTETNGNSSSIAILQEVDLIVVNLNQDVEAWKNFFENYYSLVEKCVFLIGQYQHELGWDVTRLRHKFHVARNQIGVVPYNLELQSAMNDGRMLQFLNRNYLRNSQTEVEMLIRELKRSASMIRENIILKKGKYEGLASVEQMTQ